MPRASGATRWQVVANGGPAALGALARAPRARRSGSGSSPGASPSAAADTWATSLGGLSRTPPRRLLLVGRPVPAGTSGGMTRRRDAAARSPGALLVAAVGAAAGGAPALLAARNAGRFRWDGGGLRAGRRLAGTVPLPRVRRRERMAGASLRRPDRPEGGLAWLDNDGVNLAATALAARARGRGLALLVSLILLARRLQRRRRRPRIDQPGSGFGRARAAAAATRRRSSACWQTVVVIEVPGDLQTWTTTWRFDADGTCRQTVVTESLAEGFPRTTERACTWTINGGRGRDQPSWAAATLTFDFSFAGLSPDRLVLDGFEYQRQSPDAGRGRRRPRRRGRARRAAPRPRCSRGRATACAAVDRAAFPRDKACSEYMSPETVRLLDRLGVVPALEAAGAAPLEGTAVTARARAAGCTAGSRWPGTRRSGRPASRVSRRDPRPRAGRGPRARRAPRCSERTAVEELLYDRGAVAGAVVRDARRRVGARIRARLTVGADGLRSIVARRIGRAPPRPAPPPRVRRPRRRRRRHGRLGRAARRPAGLRRDSTRSAAAAPTWRWWSRPARAARRAGGWRRSFSRRCGRFPGLHERVGGRRAGAAGAGHRARSRRGPAGSSPTARPWWATRPTSSIPFTGEGIYSALRGAELLADAAVEALGAAGPGHRGAARAVPPRPAAGLRRQVGGRAADRLRHAVPRAVRPRRRRGWAGAPAWPTRSIGVTGDFVPARRVLNPLFLARMLL